MALYARLFPKVRSHRIDHHVRPYETRPSLLEPIDAAEPGAEIAVAQMRVGQRSLLCLLHGCEELESWDVVVQQPWRRQVAPLPSRCGTEHATKGVRTPPWFEARLQYHIEPFDVNVKELLLSS